ncbi:MAG: histidine kinase, partial [Paenibacillaceae bacterium]|nr:histidine kinase [Paenibacillaceae bacterium]
IYNRGVDINRIDLISGNKLVYSTNFFISLDNNEYANAIRNRSNNRTYGIGGIATTAYGPVLSYYRYYSDYVYRDINSMIIIYLNLSFLEMASQNMLLRDAGFLSIVGRDGNYVYHPDKSLLGTKADRSLLDKLHDGKNESVEGSSRNKKLLIRQQSEYTGWTFVYEVPFRALSGPLQQMQYITTSIVIGLIALVLLILGGFAYYLSRRIALLQKIMRQAEGGNLNVKAPEISRDELGGLYRSFNRMLVQIRRLIDERNDANAKERELRKRQEEMMIEVMQTQINPHFLYNTLEVINSHAILEDIKPISTLAVSLSRLFRYSVNNDEPLVNLQQEMDHIRNYFHILHERNGSLQVAFEMEEDHLRHVACVRLALQPLIENACMHGYEAAGLPPDCIAIRGEKQGDAYELTIADRGVGMPLAAIREYNRAFALPQTEWDETNLQLYGGMWNVHRRIRLTFGMPYGLQLAERTGGGCEIRIRLPLIAPESE